MYKIHFYGAAQEVTGSCFLLESKNTKLLIDCGLFQCPKFCDIRNEEYFPFDAKSINALIATHAHIDHIGRIPRLMNAGFAGKFFSTPATRDFARVMLLDSMGVLGKEARHENKEALYKEKDVEDALEIWETVEYHQEFVVGDFKIVLKDAGHILGSAIAEISFKDDYGKTKKIVFTGDLGNPPVPLLRPTENINDAHVLVIDSTYGDRLHEDKKERVLKLERAVEDTIKKKGVLMIPAFSLERTQEIIFELNNLVEQGMVPVVPFFLDSPLAIKATEIYKKYDRYYNKEAKYIISEGDELFQFPGLKFTLKTEESKGINDVPAPKIIIAGSGMLNGGRILHHARRYMSDSKSTILFVGHQAAGSLGRVIQDCAKEISIFGEKIPVLAKISSIYGYSAHPDREQLFNFIQNTADSLEKIFTIHGEPKSLLFFVQSIRDNLGVNAIAPKYGDKFEI